MRKPRKKPIKKYTLAEFKAWLEGIEEIQPDDWCPDVTQWQMIRDKISAIVEPVAPPAPMPAPRQAPPPMVPRSRPPMAPNMGGVMPGAGPPGLELPPSALPEPEMTPAAKMALQGKLPSEIATDPAHGSKTPTIDTADGNYESNFT